MLTNAAIGTTVVVLAGIYFILPYRQAYKRRKELVRKQQDRRSGLVE